MPPAKTRLATVFTERPVTSNTRTSTFSAFVSPNANRASPACIGLEERSLRKFVNDDPLLGSSPTATGDASGPQETAPAVIARFLMMLYRRFLVPPAPVPGAT